VLSELGQPGSEIRTAEAVSRVANSNVIIRALWNGFRIFSDESGRTL
jgi:hypothetical protein